MATWGLSYSFPSISRLCKDPVSRLTPSPPCELPRFTEEVPVTPFEYPSPGAIFGAGRFFLFLPPPLSPPECVPFSFLPVWGRPNGLGHSAQSSSVPVAPLGFGEPLPPPQRREQLSWWGGRAIQPWPRSSSASLAPWSRRSGKGWRCLGSSRRVVPGVGSPGWLGRAGPRPSDSTEDPQSPRSGRHAWASFVTLRLSPRPALGLCQDARDSGHSLSPEA